MMNKNQQVNNNTWLSHVKQVSLYVNLMQPYFKIS